MDILEQDVLEVLGLVRSMKNTFAPINRIPEDVLSLIPSYYNTGEELVTLTHICRGWRERFISCPSLWTFLDCTNVEQTRVYLERSKNSPLEICLVEEEDTTFPNDAFLLAVPHLDRVKSLTLSGSSDGLLEVAKNFDFPALLLEKLNLTFTHPENPIIEVTLPNGNISLRELRLSGVAANLTWGNMSKLKTFDLRRVPCDKMSVTQLLNFFERAPLLRKIRLGNAFPITSDAPPGRVVSLPHLEYFTIIAQPTHTILLNHLSIPAGARLSQNFNLDDDKSPIPIYLPKTFENLKHVSHLTSINLSFKSGMYMRLEGPSGTHYMFGNWDGANPSQSSLDRRVLRSLTQFRILAVERFHIEQCTASSSAKIEKSPIYLTLLPMKNLHTLTLTRCFNLPFILSLNPGQNPSRTLVCPKLEDLVLYITNGTWFCIKELLAMVKERASSGAKLSTITIIGSKEFVSVKEVLKLREYVSRVEYRLDDVVPDWDDIPADDDSDITTYESDW